MINMVQVDHLSMLAEKHRKRAAEVPPPYNERLTYLAHQAEEAAEQEFEYMQEREERRYSAWAFIALAIATLVFWGFAVEGMWYVGHLCLGWKLVKP